MSQSSPIEKVAIVGATGRVGKAFAEAILKTGKHTVTAITRAGSKGVLPEGAKAAPVDYDSQESLVAALKGQQFLIITLSITAPADTHSNIVKAAAQAGVPYVMPNAFGPDFENEGLREQDLFSAKSLKHCQEIQSAGPAYVGAVCGFWYEWSLALGEPCFGIDIKNRKAAFFDDGKTPISISTWDQCGRALAALLSLPESGASPCLTQWKNKPFYFSSFRVSQRDMLDSVHRVTGTTDKDWEITFQPSAERYAQGLKDMQAGLRVGFSRAMYTRTFFPNGGGDFETSRGLANGLLGLPKEDLDEATKRTVQMVEDGFNPFGAAS